MSETKVIWQRSKYSPLLWIEYLVEEIFVPEHQVLNYSFFVKGTCVHCGKKTHFRNEAALLFMCPGHCYDMELLVQQVVLGHFVPTEQSPMWKQEAYIRLISVTDRIVRAKGKLVTDEISRGTSHNLGDVNLRLIPTEMLQRVVKASLRIDMEKAQNTDSYYVALGALADFCLKKGYMTK